MTRRHSFVSASSKRPTHAATTGVSGRPRASKLATKSGSPVQSSALASLECEPPGNAGGAESGCAGEADHDGEEAEAVGRGGGVMAVNGGDKRGDRGSRKRRSMRSKPLIRVYTHPASCLLAGTIDAWRKNAHAWVA